MKDLTITLEDRPGALAEMGEALGRAGVSIEGGEWVLHSTGPMWPTRAWAGRDEIRRAPSQQFPGGRVVGQRSGLEVHDGRLAVSHLLGHLGLRVLVR